LYLVVRKSKDFDQHYDGIVYAVFVSLGFAVIENIMYVVDGGMNIAALRAVLTIPGHGFFGVLMGYYFSLAHFHNGTGSLLYWLKALLYPILFHGVYDFILFVMGYNFEYPIIILLLFISFTYVIIRLWKLGFRKIKILTQVDKEKDEITFKDWNV
jgi:RsiW-degrading membrane proteinase PrsW (M82 family)